MHFCPLFSSKSLSKKFAALYYLLEDLLSPQKHYDWGLRAIKVVVRDLNPKSISTQELYGYINMATREWKDGLLSCTLRELANVPGDAPKIALKKPIMLVGGAGVGKTQLVKGKLQVLPEEMPALTLNLSYYTEVGAFQRALESPLEKKAGISYAPPGVGTCSVGLLPAACFVLHSLPSTQGHQYRQYYDVWSTVEPKRQELAQANAKLAEANTKLQEVQAKVAALNAQLAELESQHALVLCSTCRRLWRRRMRQWQSEACQRKLDLANRLIAALASVHSVLLGRKKYGTGIGTGTGSGLGYCRAYSFNTGDLTACAGVVAAAVEGKDQIPWMDLRYLLGSVFYGGHVVDEHDRRPQRNTALINVFLARPPGITSCH
ncbi:Dynein alpha flagellar outer arm [Chlorella sorokiniana]|uniref:Dynein alpha flagellar outer arm n=1 Tax=Chlorella sorokiniana TaxID=3076 RepID=A0A2P6U2H1_CHLSO|nr:Dynein alpha flagellar outer arm [Chlorella sorokiniana]|eukprot:PRW60500.1 Dynein alpha flagellar outer arm [Chlorella sorokiniana]